jgi:hypothetical protein
MGLVIQTEEVMLDFHCLGVPVTVYCELYDELFNNETIIVAERHSYEIDAPAECNYDVGEGSDCSGR